MGYILCHFVAYYCSPKFSSENKKLLIKFNNLDSFTHIYLIYSLYYKNTSFCLGETNWKYENSPLKICGIKWNFTDFDLKA